jgi:hypothetical protein
LETIVLWRFRDRCSKGCEAVLLGSRVCVHKQQYRSFGNLNAPISGSRNSGVGLPDDGQGELTGPFTNSLGRSFAAAVIYHNHFESWTMLLLRQEIQAVIKRDPVIVDGYDYAEHWRGN